MQPGMHEGSDWWRATFLCRVSEIVEGRSKGFDPFDDGHDTLFVVRKDGRLHGWKNACPHYGNGARMNWKKDAFLNADGSKIICAAHGAQFGIATGVCEIGPCLGKRLSPVELLTRKGRIYCVATADRPTHVRQELRRKDHDS